MAADVATTLNAWSTTAASNSPSGATAISTNLDDNLREMQAVVRQLAASTTLAAATTTDLSTVDATFVTLTGTAATITGLGTLTAGMYKWVVFNTAHTLTHGASSIILPTSANITTASGDVAMFLSLGGGIWRCTAYQRATGVPIVSGVTLSQLASATATNTLANGNYKQTWGWSGNFGTNGIAYEMDFAASAGSNLTCLRLDASGFGGTVTGTSRVLQIEGVGVGQLTHLLDITNAGYYSSGSFLRVFNTGQIDIGGASNVTGAGGFSGGTNVNISGNSAYTGGGNYTGGGVVISGGIGGGTSAGGSISISAGSNSSSNYGTVSISSDSSVARVLVDRATGVTLSGTGDTVLAQTHVIADDTNGTPTCPFTTGDGGSGGTISGSDTAGVVTFGTGSPTVATLTFANAYSTAPVAVVSGTQSGQVVHVATTTTTLQILSSSAFSSGTKVNYIVMGTQ